MSQVQQRNKKDFVWLKASYHFHTFHYRMPQTAAIAAMTPFVPSPLTIKMAMFAALFQLGDIKGVKLLAKHIRDIEVKIVPPKAALSFKAFIRYVSVPEVPECSKCGWKPPIRLPPNSEIECERCKQRGKKVTISIKPIQETGSYYQSRPHIREYAIFQSNLDVYVKSPILIRDYIEKALTNIRYIGCKDSISTCFSISEVENPPEENQCVNKLALGIKGLVVILSDFNHNIQIKDIDEFITKLIPGNREEKMYEVSAYTVPVNIKTIGRCKVLTREF